MAELASDSVCENCGSRIPQSNEYAFSQSLSGRNAESCYSCGKELSAGRALHCADGSGIRIESHENDSVTATPDSSQSASGVRMSTLSQSNLQDSTRQETGSNKEFEEELVTPTNRTHSLQQTHIMERAGESSCEPNLAPLADSSAEGDGRFTESAALPLEATMDDKKTSTKFLQDTPDKAHTRQLTSSEERFFILTQHYPNTGVFNEHSGFKIEGELNVPVLHQSISFVCDRHEALRSYVVLKSAKPMMEVVTHIDILLPVEDLSSAKKGSLSQKVMEIAQVPFNISKPPLFRVKLFKIQAQQWLLVIVMHHIVSDGDPSFTIFTREVFTCYEAILASKFPNLPATSFALSCCSDSSPKKEELSFWTEVLKGSASMVNLPWQHNPFKRSTFKGETVTVHIPAQVAEELLKLAQITNIPQGIECVLLSIFQLLLHYYSGQADISVGYPIYNRSKANRNLEVIGYFGNPVVIRTDFSSSQSFLEVTRVVSDNLRKAVQNNCPFQNVVEAVSPEWHKNALTPLFNTLFVFGTEPEVIQVANIKVRHTQIDLGLVPYDIILAIRQSSDNSLLCYLQYNSEILHKRVMTTFLQCFASLCDSVTKDPTCSTSSIPMLRGDKVLQQIETLNENTNSEYPKNKCIHDIFRECATKYPQAVAVHEVAKEGITMTYHELNVASNYIALTLLRDLKPTESVGLLMERSAVTVASILGILKAGCCYVPMDTQLTVQQIKFCVTECSIRYILCSKRYEAKVLSLKLESDVEVKVMDETMFFREVSEKEPVVSLSANGIAYTMVTSGTTGRPKAVDVPHRAVVRIACGCKYIHFKNTDVSLLHSPLNFDASTFELWSVLLNGGRLEISMEERLSPAELAKQVYSHDVSMIWLTSGLFNVMVDLDISMFRKVDHILTGGDVVNTEKVQMAQTKLPSCLFYNMYGPTECTTFTCYYKVPINFFKASVAQVPIGIPISNTRMYILDGNLMPVPTGMVGTLYIGGDGVAAGYRNATMNKDAFITAPSSILAVFPEEGRLYNSGDLVRMLPDPLKNDSLVVHFIGRSDQLVKVSGIRVDLTEVESILLQNLAIQHVSVIVKEVEADEKHLVAYVVLNQDVKVSDLQSHTRQQLPAYMVPTKFFAVDRIPLNTNDKIHRRELQNLEGSSKFQIIHTSSHRKPESENEKSIAHIWASELHVSEDAITMQFDFFENGGHSLVAQKMVSRLFEKLGVDIEITSVYSHPVFEDFVKAVNPMSSSTKYEHAMNMSEEHLSALSFQQEEFDLLERTGKYSTSNNVFAALLLHEELNERMYEAALNKVIQNHQILHSLFRDKDGNTEAIKSPLLCTVQVATTTMRKEATIEDAHLLIKECIAERFDYDRGPLMRCQLYKWEKRTVIVLVFHHIIADDITAWLIMQETVSHSTVGEIQEKDGYQLYVSQQKARQRTSSYSTELCYWEQKLAKAIMLPNFEIHQSRALSGSRSNLPVKIPGSSVREVCSQHNVSPVETVLAAFYLTIQAMTKSNDVYITSPFANRNAKKTSRLIGLTANRVVLHLKQPNDVTPKSLLQMVRKEVTETLQYQHLPIKAQYPLVGFSFITLSSEVLPEKGEPLWIAYSNIPPDQLIFLDIKAANDQVRGFLHYDQGYFQPSYMLRFISTFEESVTFLSKSESEFKHTLLTIHSDEPSPSQQNEPARRLFYNGRLIDLEIIEDAILRDGSVQDCCVTEVKESKTSKLYIYVQAYKNRSIVDDHIMKLAQTLPPCVITQVSSLPRNEQGQVDEDQLRKILVLDPALQNRILYVASRYYPGVKMTVKKMHKSYRKPNHEPVSALTPSGIYPSGRNEVKTKSSSSMPKLLQEMKRVTPEESSPMACEKKFPTTMVAALQRTVSKFPTKGITFVEDQERAKFLSYAELYQAALQYQPALELFALTKGSFVILLISKPRKLIPLWWGCVLQGIVPTIVSKALSYKETSGIVEKLYHVWKTLNRATIFTDDLPEDIKQMQNFYPEFQGAEVISISSLLTKQAPGTTPTDTSPNDLLFLQLSSGSTGAPKCIQELHSRVVAHILSCSQANKYSHSDRTLNWIPMDHVVPILMFHLKDTFLGCSQHMVDVSVVLSDPLNWLKLMTEYKATHTWAPNFGYALVAKALTEASKEDKQCIDLSAVKSLINAGEMVTPGTIRSFLHATVPFGLRGAAVQPSFGMAETATCFTYHNTVGLDSTAWFHKYGDYEFVNLGPPMQGVAIRVTDESGCELPDGEIGELEICGNVVTPGYLFNEKASSELFRDGWMRSGDHAFIVNGNLFITGRIKEQIVLRGVKYFCHEIEEKVNQVEGVASTYSAACGVENAKKGTEELVIFFCPSHPDLPKYELHNIMKRINLTVNKYFGIIASHTVVLTKGQFQKTTSGKIQRVAMKRKYLEGKYAGNVVSSLSLSATTMNIPTYSLTWKPHVLHSVVRERRSVCVILHRKGNRLSHLIGEKLKSKNCIAVSVSHHKNQLFLSELSSEMLKYTISQEVSKHSYMQLWHKLLEMFTFVDIIFNTLPYDSHGDETHLCSPWSDGHNQQVLCLLQSLEALPQNLQLKLLNVVSHSAFITSSDSLQPTRGFMSSLINVAAKELADQHYLLQVDIPEYECTSSTDLSTLASAIIQEAFAPHKETQVAYRNLQRYVPRLKEVDLFDSVARAQKFLKDRGVYIISGCTGGVGRLLSLYLHKHFNAKLILIGRSPETSIKVQDCLSFLETQSVLYTYVQGDIGREDVIDAVLKVSGSQEICGAFHLATTYEEKLIKDLTMEDFQTTTSGKVRGAVNLYKLLSQNSRESILVLFSSIYTVLPKKGLATYSAANSFLEMFQHHCSTNAGVGHKVRIVCTGWPVWKDTGLSHGHAISDVGEMLGVSTLEPDDALQLLDPLLQHESPIYIGMRSDDPIQISYETAKKFGLSQDECLLTIDKSSIDKYFIPEALLASLQKEDVRDVFGNTLHISKVYIQISNSGDNQKHHKSNEVQSHIQKHWKHILNIPEDRNLPSDNFYQMGGDSIQIAQLVSHLNQDFKVRLSPIDILEHPTMSGLASLISGLISEEKIDTNTLKKSPSGTLDVSESVWHMAQGNQSNKSVDFHLFCLPYIGMPTHLFKNWVFPGVSVWSVFYPLAPCTMKDLVSMLAEGVSSVVQEKAAPFAIIGHSFGSLLAIDIYQYLHDHEMPLPSVLIVCSMYSPLKVAEKNQPTPGVQSLSDIKNDYVFLTQLREKGFQIEPDVIIASQELHPTIEQLRYLYGLYERYECSPDMKIDCPIEVMGGVADYTITPSDIHEWSECTTMSAHVTLFPGDHFFIEKSGSRVFAKVISILMPLKYPDGDEQ